MIDRAAPAATIAWSRAVALAATVTLLLLCLLWELWLAPTGSGTLAVKALPLVLPLAGLARMRLYTYRWMSLLVWLYVAEGRARAGALPAPGGRGMSAPGRSQALIPERVARRVVR
jgi:uncharacterized membrane protein